MWNAFDSTIIQKIRFFFHSFSLYLFFLFYSLLQGISHKITLHTTLIRDQIGQGLGFSIAGGKGSPPFKDGSDGIYISRITDGGLAHRDGKILVGDKVLVVRFYDIHCDCSRQYSAFAMHTQNNAKLYEDHGAWFSEELVNNVVVTLIISHFR